jgi:hypothetical protein
MALSRPTYSSRSIDQFRSKLIGGGARPNLFEVQLAWPSGLQTDPNVSAVTTGDSGETYKFMIKAAALPASNVSVINVPFRGRNLKISGDRSFDPWTITVLNDTDFKLRNAFELWMNYVNRHNDNAGVVTPVSYQTELYVTQLGRGTISANDAGNSTTGSLPGANESMPVYKSYRIHGAFPTNVSEIALSYDTENSIEEFTVTFEYQWWDTAKGNGTDLDQSSLFGFGTF